MIVQEIKKEFNYNIIETMNRLSEVATETESYLNNETIKLYNQLKVDEEKNTVILNLKEFNKCDILIRKRLIIYTIAKVLGNSQNIEKINIEDIIKLCEKNVGNKYLMPNKNIKVLVNKGKIFFEATN